LIRCHVEALFTHDASGDLLSVNEPSGARAPRFFAGVTCDGVLLRFRKDVSASIRRALEALAIAERLHEHPLDEPIDAARYAAILAAAAPVERSETGPAYAFPLTLAESTAVAMDEMNAMLLDPLMPDWLPDVRLSQPMFASVVDGRAVSICASVRQTTESYEAGVETARPYRGQGHAGPAVIAWARAVRELEREPLYSTSWQNEPSRALARKLGLMQFGNDLHIR
jgi:RimJ/RimL family protein N-acetyltransferase